jgi:hypothetical protein
VPEAEEISRAFYAELGDAAGVLRLRVFEREWAVATAPFPPPRQAALVIERYGVPLLADAEHTRETVMAR